MSVFKIIIIMAMMMIMMIIMIMMMMIIIIIIIIITQQSHGSPSFPVRTVSTYRKIQPKINFKDLHSF